MKSRINPFLRFSSLLTAATIAFAASAQAVDYTWDGGTGNWSDTNWNTATASGPTTSGNSATINSGSVTVNVGAVNTVDSITVATGGQLNLDEDIIYNAYGNIVLQGGILNGVNTGSGGYGVSFLTGLTVSGSAASTIQGNFFNLGATGSPATFSVANVTGDANPDLNVNTGLWDLPGNSSALIKTGPGTMKMAAVSIYSGGTTLNEGNIELAGASGGFGIIKGAITVNSGTTLSLTGGDGTGFGYQGFYKATALTINGGTVTSGTSHVFDMPINMTGGTLDSTSGSFQWKGNTLNTLASPSTATIAGGGLNLRTDFGTFTQTIDVADGAAATDLLISANITQPNVNIASITKTGDGTMELSGTASYQGSTTVSGGTLVLSGASLASPNINVNATGTLALSSPIIDDGASVVIASGGSMALNFGGTDTVGSLDIDNSGPLPAGTYTSSTHPGLITGTGSLVVLAQSGTWTSLANGNWSDSANWSGSIIAVGSDNTATFSAATGVTVTLDFNRFIGNLAFSASDYIIAGANTLTLDSTTSSVPAISVASGRSATISAGLAGTDGMEKTGLGTLLLSGVKSYTGGTTVTAGTLELSSTTDDLSAVSGSLTVKSGAALKITGSDYTGLGRLGSPVTNLEVEGGMVDSSVESWVTGATVNLTGGTMSVSGSGRYQIISSGFNSIASGTTSTISGNLLIRKDYGSTDLSIDVGDGVAATDLLISGSIQQVGTAGVTKTGLGKLVLSGTNTYTGNTVVSDGELEVTGSLLFVPSTSGTNNAVSGSGTLSYTGTVDLNLSGANLTNGNTWTLFSLSSYAGLMPTAVTSTAGSFTNSSGTWTLVDGANTWTFVQSTGVLSLAVASSPYATWGSPYGLLPGSEGGDLDNDGVTNFEEFAFGLIPNSGSSINPITLQVDKSTGKFTYQRLTASGLTYTVWYSTDLATWLQDTTATQGTPIPSGANETVEVTLTPALLANPKLFVRVIAQ